MVAIQTVTVTRLLNRVSTATRRFQEKGWHVSGCSYMGARQIEVLKAFSVSNAGYW